MSLPGSAKPNKRSFLTSPLPVGVLCAALLLTFGWTRYYRMKQDETHHAIFERYAQGTEADLKARLQIYMEALMAGKALFAASTEVNRLEWNRFYESMGIRSQFPGIQAIQFVRRVKHADKASFERAVRNDRSINPRGYPAFSIWPEGNRDDYFVVDFNEPMERNERAFGFDSGSEARRREAITSAIRTGMPMSSGVIHLVQDPKNRPAFIINIPLYTNGLSASSPEARERAFVGFVVGVFVPDDLLRNALDPFLINQLDIKIYDGNFLSTNESGPPQPKDLLYDSIGGNAPSTENGSRFRHAVLLNMAGRPWTVIIEPNQMLAAEFEGEGEFWIGATGAVMSLLAYWLAVSLEARSAMMAKIREHEERYRHTFNDSNAVMLNFDPDTGAIADVNAAACRFYGRTREALLTLRYDELCEPSGTNCRIDQRHNEANFYLLTRHLAAAGPRDVEIYGARMTAQNQPLIHIIVHDVTDRITAEERLIAEKSRAEEATRLKDKFVSLVSHDIRSPLSTLLGMLRLLDAERDKFTAEERAIITRRMTGICDGLLHLADGLLETSRLRDGGIAIKPRFADAHALCGSIMDGFREQAAAKTVTLINDLPPGARIYADLELISSVFRNLLGNALKFCRSGDTIRVWRPGESPGGFCVEDTGVGIVPEMMPDLFSHEVRTSTVGTTGERGAGWGLPLCRDIVKAHGGNITATSTLGIGSRFAVELPMGRPRALLVEDDPTSLFTLQQYLEKLDIEVIPAGNGLEALAALNGNAPDIVVTDIVMPEMDGLELLSRLRARDDTRKTPVILVTARDDTANRGRGFGMGADDFVVKPVLQEDLTPRITRFVGRNG